MIPVAAGGPGGRGVEVSMCKRMIVGATLGAAVILLGACGGGDESSSSAAGAGGTDNTGGSGAAPTGSEAGSGGASPAGGHDCNDPDPNWLLCEDFEQGGGDFDTWLAASDFVDGDGTDDRGRIDLANDPVHGGDHSVFMPAAAASGYEGASLDWRACDGPQETNCAQRSYERLYFRVWVRFADDHRYVHHFLNIGGSQPDDFWYHGTAGCLPDGELAMGTTVDFEENTHESYFYTYSPDMRCDTNCGDYADVASICQECADKGLPTCDQQPQCCWGNEYGPDTPHAFPVGEWFCFEMMMQANTPGEHDGIMAYWVNDVEIHRETNMLWRTVPELSLNRIRVQHYITTSDADDHSNRVWFDDVVVSTDRIGCE